ncbi:MAG: thioredoxin domain-containing protein [Pseudomonadota bacterium]
MKAFRWFFPLLLCGVIFLAAPAGAEVELFSLETVALNSPPVDVAASIDGKIVYILTGKTVMIYDIERKAVVREVALSRAYDRIDVALGDLMVLTATVDKRMEIMRIDDIQPIVTDNRPFKGPADAPVTIAVFDDYQCPYCARLEPLLEKISKQFPKEVKLVIKHYPLTNIHKHAFSAAVAALAAHRQGKFWEFHSEVFKHFKDLDEDKINQSAVAIGLNMDRFQKDRKDKALQDMVAADMNNGQQIGVKGTPTIYINGVQMRGRSEEALVEQIQSELKKAG